MLSEVKKCAKRWFILLFFATVIALGLKVIAYALPNDLVRENVKQSAMLMARDGYFRQSIPGTTGADIDNFSLSFWLSESVFEGKYSFVEKVMLSPSYLYGVPKYYEVLNATNKVPSDDINIYGRYWQGAVFFLKVLHIWFNLDEIRMINLALQTLLLVSVLLCIYKKLNVFYALAYLVAVIFCQPLTLAYSIPYSPLYYLVLLYSLLVLNLDKRYVNDNLFFMFGCGVCFVDFLTYPLVGLCFPLFLAINLYGENFKKDVLKIIKYSVAWSVGYLGFWFNKFLLATIFTDENILKDGMSSMWHRLTGYQTLGGDFSFLFALERNWGEYIREVNVYIVLAYVVVFLLCFLGMKRKFKLSYMMMINLIIGLYPFVWCLLARNHSVEHPGSVYRIFTISIIAIGGMLGAGVVSSKNDVR